MLLSHPLFGGFDMMTRFAETYIGAGHRFVAPSRFRYLGSSLPSGAMPADQADGVRAAPRYARHRSRRRVRVLRRMPSAIQFAFRHPKRTTALVLMASALPGKAGAPPEGRGAGVLRVGSIVLDLQVVRALPVRADPRDAQGFRRHPRSASASSRPWTACSRSVRASEECCSPYPCRVRMCWPIRWRRYPSPPHHQREGRRPVSIRQCRPGRWTDPAIEAGGDRPRGASPAGR